MGVSAWRLWLATTAAVCAGGAAHAQTTSAGRAASPAAAQLEELIVVARRMEESQQSVPLAVTAITDQRLQNAAVSSVADIQRLVPSLQVGQANTGAQHFTIRGSFNGVYNDPGVIAYIDEVPVDSRAIVYSLFDLSSVQELKGPQGTLFGRNSTGGALLFVSKKPSPESSGGYVHGRLGSLDERRFEGAANLAVSETLALRVAGAIQRRDGLQESVAVPGREYGDRRNEALRLSLLWRPAEGVETYTQITHYDQRERHTAPVLASLATPCTAPTSPSPLCLYQPPFNAFLGTGDILALFNRQRTLRSDQTVTDAQNFDRTLRHSVTNAVTWTFGDVSLKSITYYGVTKLNYAHDFDGTPLPIFDVAQPSKTKTFYSELQLFGTALEGRLDWRVGGVYSQDRTAFGETVYLFTLPLPSASNPIFISGRQDFRSYAIFGQGTYDLSDAVEGLSLTAGYRHTWDDRTTDSTIRLGQPTTACALQTLPVPATGPRPFPNTDLTRCVREIPLDFDSYNYNLTAAWQVTDKVLVYAATRRGYKAGSFNQNALDPTLVTYQPEFNRDYELGLKADWRLGSVPVRTNVALFRQKYTNIQATTVNIDPRSVAIQVLVLNRDPVTGRDTRATIEGVEVEATAALTSWLQVSGFWSKLSATYDRFVNPATRVDLSGQKVSGVVPTTLGFTAQASLPVTGPFDSLDVTASYYRTADPLANAALPAFTNGRETFDARIAARNLFGSGADVAVFGRDLNDAVACTINPAVTGSTTRQCGEGRSWGVELRYAFGGERR